MAETAVVVGEIVEVPADLIDEAPWNPNEQAAGTFNDLVENLREVGMVENPVLIPSGSRYVAVSGNHRVRAAKVLGWTTIPCRVEPAWTEDQAKAQTMRMNMIKGTLNPVKFTKLARDFVAKYGSEGTARLFAFPTSAAFEKVFLDLKRNLPVRLGSQLEDEKKKVRTVKDLANVLEEIMAKAGSTVQQSYVVFSYGGREHLYVALDAGTKRDVWRLKALADASGLGVNELLAATCAAGLPAAEAQAARARRGAPAPVAPEPAEPSVQTDSGILHADAEPTPA